MKQRTSFVIYMIIALGVLGSGMLFNAMGTDLDVWNTFLPENYPEIFPRIRGPVGTKLELELTRNGTDSLRHSAIFDSDGAIYLENIFKDSSSIDETYNIPKGNFISTFGNNIVFPQNNQKGINNIEINVYNVKGQLVEKVPHHIQNGFVVGHFDGNGKSEGKYFFQVKNGENVFYKPFLLNKDNNSPVIPDSFFKSASENEKSVNEHKYLSDAKDKTTIWNAKYTYIPDKVNNPINWWHQISTFYGQINSTESVHEVEEQYLTPFVPMNYIQGYVTEMMTGNPISNLPVKFVKVLEKNPFGEEFKFVYDVLAETTTDANGYYKTNAISVQDSVFAMIGTKDDDWMDTEHTDFTYVMDGTTPPDSLEHDHNNIVYKKMDGFVSHLPMHITTDLDSLEISRTGSKFVNYALYPNWENVAVRDTIPDVYINESDVVNEQIILGIPLNKLHNNYYVYGRENKCAMAFRDDVPFGLYLVPGQFNENQINYIKETMLKASMLEKGLTRSEAESFEGGFGGRYKFITEDPDVTGEEPAMRVVAGANVYWGANVADNHSSGYNTIAVDNGNYAEISTDNENEIRVELGSNVARNYTAYTIGLANTMTSGHKKVDQMFIPMETKFYQLQKTGANNATMNELIGKYYGFDY